MATGKKTPERGSSNKIGVGAESDEHQLNLSAAFARDSSSSLAVMMTVLSEPGSFRESAAPAFPRPVPARSPARATASRPTSARPSD